MATIDGLVEQWMAIDTNEKTRDEIKKLQAAGDYKELEKRLGSRIQFGTAGLRARMEAGFSRMNDVTVLQASQGLAKYVTEQNQQQQKELRVVIGHDHRHNSKRFAELACLAFAQLGFKIYNFGMVHTPMVPFGVDSLDALCGVMVTASHNPALDNGYKVYWSNGCQIIPPHDSGIAACIEQNLQPWTWDMSVVDKADVDTSAVKQVEVQYFERLKSTLNFTAGRKTPAFKFVYTPMHGVGLPAMTKACETLGLQDSMVVVPEQAYPDPDFATVKFPNPEEQGALDLAKKVADENNIRLILASDPDADRFVAAVKSTITDQWCQLSGNQIGSLFGYYMMRRYEEEHHGDLSRLAMLNSTVSSEMNSCIASNKKFKFQDSLTGFKWIGNNAIDLEKQGYDVPFAYEEALGYMFGSVVHDKDGISAAYVFMQLAALWAMQGTDALEKIQDLYRQFGYFAEHNSYYIVPDPSVTTKVFAAVRQNAKPYPSQIGKYRVRYWRDLTIGFDSSTPDNVPSLPVSSSVEMITVKLDTPGSGSSDDYVRFTARGSGTEPKLKVYIEARSVKGAVEAQDLADDVWNCLREHWFHQPELTPAGAN